MEDKKINAVHYVAKYNHVWKNLRTGEMHGNSIALTGKEKITDFKEVYKPKDKIKDMMHENMDTGVNPKPIYSNYNLNKK